MTARPGGWVPGIGWVALLCDVGSRVRYRREVHDPEDESVPWDEFNRFPVIVTRWADGTEPEAPKKPDTDTLREAACWCFDETHHEQVVEPLILAAADYIDEVSE